MDFGIDPSIGLNVKPVPTTLQRDTAQAQLGLTQSQLQEHQAKVQGDILANQQKVRSAMAGQAIQKMLQTHVTNGTDPTWTDFVLAGGPVDGVAALKSYHEEISQRLAEHKSKLDEAKSVGDWAGNVHLSLLDAPVESRPDMLKNAVQDALHSGQITPEVADAMMQEGVTDPEIRGRIGENANAYYKMLDKQKQDLDRAQEKLNSDLRVNADVRAEKQLKLDQDKLDAEKAKPQSFAPGSLIKTPGQPDQQVPKEPTTPSVDEQALTAYLGKNPGKTAQDYISWKAQQTPTAVAAAGVTKPSALDGVDPKLITPATAAAEKHQAAYTEAVQASNDMKTFIDLAKSGNKMAYSYAPTEGVLTLNTARGVKRVNMTEIEQYGGAGSALDHIKAFLGKQLSGESIPAGILDDMATLHQAVAANAKTAFGNKLAGVNKIYGTKFNADDLSGDAAPTGTVKVQIPGHPPGTIPASALPQFLKDNQGAKQIQ